METKLYYTIGEIAEKFKVAPSLIRFWESEFPRYIKPNRNKRGVRFYTIRDIDNIEKIYHLVKECRYTLDGAKQALKDKDNIISEIDIESKISNDGSSLSMLVKEKLLKIKDIGEKFLTENESF